MSSSGRNTSSSRRARPPRARGVGPLSRFPRMTELVHGLATGPSHFYRGRGPALAGTPHAGASPVTPPAPNRPPPCRLHHLPHRLASQQPANLIGKAVGIERLPQKAVETRRPRLGH